MAQAQAQAQKLKARNLARATNHGWMNQLENQTNTQLKKGMHPQEVPLMATQKKGNKRKTEGLHLMKYVMKIQMIQLAQTMHQPHKNLTDNTISLIENTPKTNGTDVVHQESGTRCHEETYPLLKELMEIKNSISSLNDKVELNHH